MRQILERASKNIGGDFYSANEIIHYFKERKLIKIGLCVKYQGRKQVNGHIITTVIPQSLYLN